MKTKKWKKYGQLIAILLTVSMLCACSIQRAAPPANRGETQQDYETYEEDSLILQNKFTQLTDDLFKKEVSKSTIDLHFSLSDPTAYGITEVPITFGEFSLDRMKSDSRELTDLKKQLADIDCERLTEDQQLTYRILKSYVNTELLSDGLELYAQPLGPTIGIQAQLPVLLAEYTFYNKQDVENYLLLLAQIDTYYNQLLDFEKEKSAAGLFMSDAAVDHIIQSCDGYLLKPDHSFMAETFNTRLDTVDGLTDEEKNDYKARNLQMLTEHFVPAYQSLVDGLAALKGTGTNDKGLSYYPEGKRYYEYLVKSSTGTSYASIPELQNAIEEKMNAGLNDMSDIITKNPEIGSQLGTYTFSLTDPQEILENLKAQISTDFPPLPECDYTVKYVPKALENTLSPAFYLVPPIDRYQDNTIYINGGEKSSNADLFTTLAHEGYPGHLYQSVYFIDQNECNLRHIMSFSSYSEGWATYVENYSYTLDNGLSPELGALLAQNSFTTLSLYAMLDIYINYDGWDQTQVAEYLGKYYNIEGTDIVDSIYSALIENPTNYLEYYVGCLEIMNLRDIAQEKLGANFTLMDFHKFILDIGPAPFSVIRPYFQTWLIASKL